jgi:hypothetical protein
MKCESCDLAPNLSRFIPCKNESVTVLWCPTWTTASGGPMHICEQHARNFKPEFNPHAKDGAFYWGDDAYNQFNAVYHPKK